MCSAHDAPVLLGAGLADHRLQAVERGEPRSLPTDQTETLRERAGSNRAGCGAAGPGCSLPVVAVPISTSAGSCSVPGGDGAPAHYHDLKRVSDDCSPPESPGNGGKHL